MTDATETTVTIPFEITGWDEAPNDTPGEGPPLVQTLVRKRFDGALTGTSVARLLTARADEHRLTRSVRRRVDPIEDFGEREQLLERLTLGEVGP